MDNLRELCHHQYFPRKLSLRSPNTRAGYEYALRAFAKYLGHEATLSDLDDDVLVGWTKSLIDEGLSHWTIREKVGRITALWNWLAKRRIVERFPCVEKLAAPEITPVAFSHDDLKKIFVEAAYQAGTVAGIKARDWWQAYLAFIWSTGERKSAVLAVRWEWVDFKNHLVKIPANVRKGGRKPALYDLWPEVESLLKRIAKPARELVFPWDRCEVTYYHHFNRLLKRAGLPTTRKHKTHALRVSHATWLKVAGGDPTRSLMHSDAAVTNRHYLDPAHIPREERKLFVPWGADLAKMDAEMAAVGQFV